MSKKVYFVSDSTGITVQTLGDSLMSQFDNLDDVVTEIVPYIDSEEKATQLVNRINAEVESGQCQVLVFETVADESVKARLSGIQGEIVDILATFLNPMERFFNTSSSFRVGKDPKVIQAQRYKSRIEAVHFALDNDDGARLNQYDKADVILVGVSRSGKTPSCLYMALQFGIFAANYPITEEDLEGMKLPRSLRPYKDKLFGLTIDPDRLAAIRHERKANSRYASIQQCEMEVHAVESIYRRHGIPFVDTTQHSIEEITTRILDESGLKRH